MIALETMTSRTKPPASSTGETKLLTSRIRVSAGKAGIIFLILSTALRAATWQAEIKPGPSDNFTKAAFSLWLDESSPTPVALLVIAPGWNGDGRNTVNDANWQTFARDQHLGLVGVCLQSDERDEQKEPYHVATHGSGNALLKAIAQLSVAAKKPGLGQAPLLFWGHSAGGQFGYGMACHAPARAVAFVAIKGGIYLSEPTPSTFAVPGLFIVGENDEIMRAMNITRLFETGRAKGAPWCMAFEPASGHEVGRSNEIALPFLRGALARRLDPACPSPLRPVTQEGWTGVRSSLEIQSGAAGKTLPSPRTVWLPDKTSAKAWQMFSETRSPE